MHMNERRVAVGDIDLSIAEAGAGQSPLLLVHGFTGAKEDFTPWLDRLAASGWHAVAPDLRGHGASSKPGQETDYSFEIMAHDMLDLTDALGWERFVLLGHSMGGMVAQFMACEAPARLEGLILMDTAHGPLRNLDPDLVNAAVTIVRSQGMDALASILTERQGPLETVAHRRLIDGQAGYAEFCDRKLRATSPALYASMAPAFISAPDRLDSLRALPESLPVLVIAGEMDEPFLGPSKRIAAGVGEAVLEIIPDAGHCPQFENTQAWWQALSRFLATVAPTGAFPA